MCRQAWGRQSLQHKQQQVVHSAGAASHAAALASSRSVWQHAWHLASGSLYMPTESSLMQPVINAQGLRPAGLIVCRLQRLPPAAAARHINAALKNHTHAPKKPPFLPSSARTTTAAPLHVCNSSRAGWVLVCPYGAGATAAARRRRRLAAGSLGTPIAPARITTSTGGASKAPGTHLDRRAGWDWAPRRAARPVPRRCVELASCCMVIGALRGAGVLQEPPTAVQALRWLPQLIRSALTRLALPVRSDESDGRLAGCRGVLRLRRPPTRSILSSPARSMLGPKCERPALSDRSSP